MARPEKAENVKRLDTELREEVSGVAFGPGEPYTDRIKGILEEYPEGTQIKVKITYLHYLHLNQILAQTSLPR